MIRPRRNDSSYYPLRAPIVQASSRGPSARGVAQEDALHLGRLQQLRRRAAKDGPPGYEDVAAIGQAEGQLHALLDEDHADALLVPDAPDEAAEIGHLLQGEPKERLVDLEPATAEVGAALAGDEGGGP